MSRLSSYLKSLNQIRPDASWRASARDFILTQCTEKKVSSPRMGFAESIRAIWSICWNIQWSLLARPVAVSVAVFFLVVVGSGVAVQAAKSSIPGDILYPVKLATESVQISLTWKGPRRTKLNAEFATRRLDEAVTLAKNPATPKEHIVQVIADFTARLDTARKDLETTKQASPAHEVVEAAKALDAHTKVYEEKLAEVKHDLSPEVKTELKDAVNAAVVAVDDASSKSLETLVEQAEKDGQVSKEEVKNLLQYHLTTVTQSSLSSQERVGVRSASEARDSASTDGSRGLQPANDGLQNDLDQKTVEVKSYLENNDLSKALTAVTEARALVRKAAETAVILEDDGLDEQEEKVVTPIISPTPVASLEPNTNVKDSVDNSETPGAVIIIEENK